MLEPSDITLMLQDVDAGKAGAMDRLMEAVYADLEGVAERHMAKHFGHGMAGVTLEPAALVNESFLRLIKQRNTYDNRGHFFAIATSVMLRVLTDYQRSRGAAKRGGHVEKVTLNLDCHAEPNMVSGGEASIEVGALVEALDRLETLDARKANVVKLRVVWGLEMQEIAGALAISLATVERDWSFAKAWLAREAQGTKPVVEVD